MVTTQGGPAGEPPPQRWIALGLLSLVLVLGMSTWFSASAVVSQLAGQWSLDATGKAWLTIAVQLGFVAGALTSAVLNLADRVSLRVVILVGCVGAGLANATLLAADNVWQGLPPRFASGFLMAAVYPPAFKLISTWFLRQRGLALGVLVAGIVLGSASPHAVNALGGVDWRIVIAATSAMSVLGGVVVLLVGEGPYPFPRARFDPRQVGLVFSNRGVRLASIGYFGHMWELFAMWAWFLVYFGDFLDNAGQPSLTLAAWVTFAVLASGAAGSLVGGWLADWWGRTRTTSLMLGVSGACSVAVGLLFDAPTWVVVVVGLVWGFTVVADSAQFSAIVTEVADQTFVGTALTMQMAIGFTITVTTIWLIPLLEIVVTWHWAFAILVLGPAAGIAAMLRLRSLPEAERIAGGLG